MRAQGIAALELVARLGSAEDVVDDEVRAELAVLLPHTTLAGAALRLGELETETGARGMRAIRRAVFLHPVEPSTPGSPRHPPNDADVALAARLLSPEVVPDDDVREALTEHLKAGPLGPAVWRVLDVEWAVATPSPDPHPPRGDAALTQWRAAGRQVEQLLVCRRPQEAVSSNARYCSTLVAHQLLDRARQLRLEHPRQHRSLASLAVTVAHETHLRFGAGPHWRSYGGLLALALATEANASRIMGDLPTARRLLDQVKPFLASADDPATRWEILLLSGATLTYLERAEEAKKTFGVMAALAREMRDGHRLAKTLVQRTVLDCLAGSLTEESLERMRTAATLADPNRDPWLGQMTLLNLAQFQAELGYLDDAAASWAKVEPFAEGTLELIRSGVLGLIRLRRGDWKAAIDTLTHTSEGLLAKGHAAGAYYQLLLAVAQLRAGRTSEANRTSLTAARFFETVQMRSIALQATNVAAAARQGMVTEEDLRRLAMMTAAAPPERSRPGINQRARSPGQGRRRFGPFAS